MIATDAEYDAIEALEAETLSQSAVTVERETDPTLGMTDAQKERYLKSLNAKPRPRDLFNVEELVK